jgi:hypothetical protein
VGKPTTTVKKEKMNSNLRGNWCIHYCERVDPTKWYTMKSQNIDDILMPAKTYDEVFKFAKYRDAWNFAKGLINDGALPRYDAQVRRVCRARGDAFYLSGN